MWTSQRESTLQSVQRQGLISSESRKKDAHVSKRIREWSVYDVTGATKHPKCYGWIQSKPKVVRDETPYTATSYRWPIGTKSPTPWWNKIQPTVTQIFKSALRAAMPKICRSLKKGKTYGSKLFLRVIRCLGNRSYEMEASDILKRRNRRHICLRKVGNSVIMNQDAHKIGRTRSEFSYQKRDNVKEW